MNFENALYYTFSTVTQTLGGATALLGAFVLLRYQIIDSRLHSAATVSRTAMKLSQALADKSHQLFLFGNYAGLREALNPEVTLGVQSGQDGAGDAAAALDQIRYQLSRRTQLLHGFGIALFTSALLMGLSTFFLAMVPYYLGQWYQPVILIVAVALFVGVLVQFAMLLYFQLRD